MRIGSEQLPRHLQGRLASLYTVCGDELLAIEAADQIRARARDSGHAERQVVAIDPHFDWSQLLHRANSLSLFGERRIMDVRIPSGKPGTQGGAAIEAYCRSLPPDTVTLVTLPRMDKPGMATRWFQALDHAGVVVQAFPVERARLPEWIGRRLQAQGQDAAPETLRFLADRVEGNLLAAHQELQKLALLHPAGMLSFEQVKDAVLDVARYDAYQLSNALVAGDVVRYARVLEGLRGEGTALPLIVGVLAGQIRALLAVRRGRDAGRPLAQLMNQARIWGSQQKLAEEAVGRLGTKQLIRALRQAARIDRIGKGVAAGDAWDELLQLGVRLARGTARGASSGWR